MRPSTRRMVRWVLIGVGLCIAGFATTVGTAIVGTMTTDRNRLPQHLSGGAGLNRVASPFWSSTRVLVVNPPNTVFDRHEAFDRWQVTRRRWREAPDKDVVAGPRCSLDHPADCCVWFFHEAGWPCTVSWSWAAMHYGSNRYQSDDGGGNGTRNIPVLGARPAGSPNEIGMPTKLYALGLVANTACFACAWACLLLGQTAMRRAIRRWQGRCRQCGYDLRGLPSGAPCPECGRALAGSDA